MNWKTNMKLENENEKRQTGQHESAKARIVKQNCNENEIGMKTGK